jgi:hypothetical protein
MGHMLNNLVIMLRSAYSPLIYQNTAGAHHPVICQTALIKHKNQHTMHTIESIPLLDYL